jgi:hypothetical protein
MPALQEFPIKDVFTSPIKTLYEINLSPKIEESHNEAGALRRILLLSNYFLN